MREHQSTKPARQKGEAMYPVISRITQLCLEQMSKSGDCGSEKDRPICSLVARSPLNRSVDHNGRQFDVSFGQKDTLGSCFAAAINGNLAFVVQLPKSYDVELRECVFWVSKDKTTVYLSKPEKEEVSVQGPLIQFEARWIEAS
jgi:hypothetical protein